METMEISPAIQVAVIGLLGALLGVVASWARQLLRANRKARQTREKETAERADELQALLEEQARALRVIILEERRKAYAGLLSLTVHLQAVKYGLLGQFTDPESEKARDAMLDGMEQPYFDLLTASKMVELVSDDPAVLRTCDVLLFDAMLVTAYGDVPRMRAQLESLDSSQRQFAIAAGNDLYRIHSGAGPGDAGASTASRSATTA